MSAHNTASISGGVRAFVLASMLFAAPLLYGQNTDTGLITLSMHNTELSKVMEMLSRQQRVNILLTGDVGGEVSFNLYDVELEQAIRSIASAAGYAVEFRDDSYFIVSHDEAGKYAPDGVTQVKSFDVLYADAEALEKTLEPYLSSYGALTLAPERRLLIVEDTPEFVERIEKLLFKLDRKPTQILIEAKILEVTLDNEESFGVDWSKLFNSDGGSGSVGTQGLSRSDAAGFFFNYATPNVEATLAALSARGRVRTLSTPKLLALQNQEASVIIGDRRGYQVTTTINQVTTESIEFLESGVILRVTPNVDAQGNVMLDIHPEVSNGSVDANGIPSQTTTEVTTQLIVPAGQTVFIGGLMKHTLTETSNGVPVLGGLPGVGRLFSSSEQSNVNTETIVLITPHVVSTAQTDWSDELRQRVEAHSLTLHDQVENLHEKVNERYPSTAVPLGSYRGMRMSTTIGASTLSRTEPAQFDASHPYTLYLFHCYTRQDADHFAQRYRNLNDVRIREDSGQQRYLVMYGRYASETDARRALDGLPVELSRLQPLVRREHELLARGW